MYVDVVMTHLIEFGRLFVRLAIWLFAYVMVGAAVTVLISVIYVNSSNYCKDCDTGLGLCAISYCLALFITPMILIGLSRGSNWKRKNDEFWDKSAYD